MKTLQECCAEVAKNHGLGNSLVIGHKATYWIEAAELYVQQFKDETDQQIRAGERLRMMDAASAINEANELRQKITDQDLIIYGITEGSGQWETLANDRLRDIEVLKEEKAKLIEEVNGYRESLKAHLQHSIEMQECGQQEENNASVEEGILYAIEMLDKHNLTSPQ